MPNDNCDDYMWRTWRWMLGLLALVSLVACGAPEQGAGPPQPDLAQITAGATQPSTVVSPTDAPSAAQPTSPPIQPATATSQLVRPTVGPRPSPIQQPPRSLRPTATPLVVPSVAPANTTAPVAGVWQTYRNDQAGFRIDYPPDWITSEQVSETGAFFTAFTPASGGPGITVVAQAGDPPIIVPSETSDRRCERVVVGGLNGTRCFDPGSSILSATLAGKGRTYVIATTGSGVAETLYQRCLDSFAPSGAAPPPVGPNARKTPTHRTLATPRTIVTP
jgi:hypothetical protein